MIMYVCLSCSGHACRLRHTRFVAKVHDADAASARRWHVKFEVRRRHARMHVHVLLASSHASMLLWACETRHMYTGTSCLIHVNTETYFKSRVAISILGDARKKAARVRGNAHTGTACRSTRLIARSMVMLSHSACLDTTTLLDDDHKDNKLNTQYQYATPLARKSTTDSKTPCRLAW